MDNWNLMKTKHELELADVKAIAAAAEAEALKNKWAVTIAIVDDGGHLLWLQRLDGAAAVSAHIASSKARSAALGRRDTKGDRKSTRLNSSHQIISYAVFCLKKKKINTPTLLSV